MKSNKIMSAISEIRENEYNRVDGYNVYDGKLSSIVNTIELALKEIENKSGIYNFIETRKVKQYIDSYWSIWNKFKKVESFIYGNISIDENTIIGDLSNMVNCPELSTFVNDLVLADADHRIVDKFRHIIHMCGDRFNTVIVDSGIPLVSEYIHISSRALLYVDDWSTIPQDSCIIFSDEMNKESI